MVAIVRTHRFQGADIFVALQRDGTLAQRLPTGIFFEQGVKANVLFFDKMPASEQHATKELLDLLIRP
jgi:hypothetical protein